MLAWVSASKYIEDVKGTVEAAQAFAKLLAMCGSETSEDMMEALQKVGMRSPRSASAIELLSDARGSAASGVVDVGTSEHPPLLVRRRLSTVERT